jgi:Thermophilic metalloprotease (M29)
MVCDSYITAFKILLKKSVDADRSKDIVVLYDEFFFKFFDSFSAVTNELLLKVTYIFVPDSYQQILQNNKAFYNNGEIELPGGIHGAMNSSDIVLNFLTGSSNASKVRGSVLNSIKDNGCKVVHSPKMTDEILKIIEASSFEKISSDCEMVAWGLGTADSATIISTDNNHQEFKLNIKLGGWNNDPFISAGVIFENSWGNVPPGEAFCCPKPMNVNGLICVNGSVPGYSFKKSEYLYLEFSKGKITDWKASPHSKPSTYFKKLKQNAMLSEDDNWDTFAELGIGLNPVIKSLTGNPLFDEKMAGTIHIAIGDNVCFGHPIQSHIHEDLVVLRPTLFLDEKKIIDKGKFKIKVIRDFRKKFTPPSIDILELSIISFKYAKIYVSNGEIKRKLKKANRVGYVDIFNQNSIKIPPALYNFLKDDNIDEITFSQLLKIVNNDLDRISLKKIIEIFIHYKMASIKSIL